MTKKVLKFKRTVGGKYTSRQMVWCGSSTREYLDVDKAFDLHCSTEKPRGDDEYYVLAEGRPDNNESREYWYLTEGPDKGHTPTTGALDRWLTNYFAGKKVYIWAMG